MRKRALVVLEVIPAEAGNQCFKNISGLPLPVITGTGSIQRE
jgi:hypothetical protein